MKHNNYEFNQGNINMKALKKTFSKTVKQLINQLN